MAMEGYTLSLFMAGPKSRLEATRFVQNRCTRLRPKMPTTTSFGKKSLFICGHICLGMQLLPKINNSSQEVLLIMR